MEQERDMAIIYNGGSGQTLMVAGLARKNEDRPSLTAWTPENVPGSFAKKEPPAGDPLSMGERVRALLLN